MQRIAAEELPLEALPGDVVKPMAAMTEEELRAFVIDVRTERTSNHALYVRQAREAKPAVEPTAPSETMRGYLND
jgi:hypothetical protein